MSNYPAGAENDPNAPYNQPEEQNFCAICDEPCEGSYCSYKCFEADML